MNIGFIGLGDMGGPIAMRLLDTSNMLAVLDLRADSVQPFAERGARVCATPAEVARHAEVLFTCLPGPAEMRAVALGPDGIADGLHAGMTYVDLTTNSPDLIREVALAFARAGVAMVDAPVSGGAVGARAGTLAVFVGGDKAQFDRVLPVLRQFGDDKIRHCGPLGTGNVVKLCNNLINNVLKCLLPEVFALGVKAGATARELFDAFSAGSGNSTMLQLAARTALEGTMKGSFPGVAIKDVGLALELARLWKLRTPIGAAVLARLEESFARGYGIDLWQLLAHDASVELSFAAPRLAAPAGLPDAGSVIRLCNTVLAAAMLAVIPEAFAIGIRGGVSQHTLYQAIHGGTGGNAMLDLHFHLLLEARANGRTPGPGDLPAVDTEDLHQALAIANEVGVPMPVAKAVLARMLAVTGAGHGDRIYAAAEQESGVKFGFEPA